jgi:hypothetical protein
MHQQGIEACVHPSSKKGATRAATHPLGGQQAQASASSTQIKTLFYDQKADH